MEVTKELVLTGYSNVVSYECFQKIGSQMEKNICKFKIGDKQGTGFFCKIPFPNMDNMLSVFITNNHLIKEELLNYENEQIIIKIKEDEDEKKINLNGRFKYTNIEYDTTIIEIQEKDGIKKFMELDDKIINN